MSSCFKQQKLTSASATERRGTAAAAACMHQSSALLAQVPAACPFLAVLVGFTPSAYCTVGVDAALSALPLASSSRGFFASLELLWAGVDPVAELSPSGILKDDAYCALTLLLLLLLLHFSSPGLLRQPGAAAAVGWRRPRRRALRKRHCQRR
jgi:hypothetical protein